MYFFLFSINVEKCFKTFLRVFCYQCFFEKTILSYVSTESFLIDLNAIVVINLVIDSTKISNF